MESSVSLGFFVSVRVLQKPITERHQRKSTLGRNSRLEAKTASKLVATKSFKGGIFSSDHRCQRFLAAASVLFGDTVSYSLDVSSCVERKISGYWIGPDIDDGWGFIEAYVDWKF